MSSANSPNRKLKEKYKSPLRCVVPALERSRDTWKKRTQERNSEIRRLERRLGYRDGRIERNRKQLEELKRELEEKEEHIRNSQKELARLTETNKELKNELTQMFLRLSRPCQDTATILG